jgi:SAM-dependent methyltransferase
MEEQATSPRPGSGAEVTGDRRLGPLSDVARRGKVKYFLDHLPTDARILDVGCADNWFKAAARARGYHNVTGLDLYPPADIVGDVWTWRSLGLEGHSYDAIIAFEVIEHGDFAQPFHELLKPDGLLCATTPVPRYDPVCKALERLRLLQQRSSPHSHLIDLRAMPHFEIVERRIRAVISQWAILRPAGTSPIG